MAQEGKGEPRLTWLKRAASGTQGAPPVVGVLSGTFNPPTRAHLALAREAMARLRLDEVVFVLPQVPPHKGELEASLEDRAEMLRRMLAREANFSAGICSHGLFLDQHRAIAPHYPKGTRFLFLTGRDAAERILLHWPYAEPRKALEEMFARFEFAVAARGGEFNIPAGTPAARHAAKIHPFHIPPEYEALSATRAREAVGRGERIETYVPEKVAEYMRAKGLYRQDAKMGEP